MEEGGDAPAYAACALGVVARARNMSQLARDAGPTRQKRDKALSADGNPGFATVSKVARALGLRVACRTASGPSSSCSRRRSGGTNKHAV